MSYRGPGEPIYRLKLKPGSRFGTVRAVPVPAWHMEPEALGQWQSIYSLDPAPGSFVRTERSFPIRTSLVAREAYSFSGLGQTAPSPADVTDAHLANDAGIPVPVLRAIRHVESGASPSAVRFEPHVYWRLKLGLSQRATGAQVAAAIPSGGQSQVPYTPGPTRAASAVGSETNRAAFNRAFAISPANAVRATSWGSYQVLGGHLLPMFGNDANRAVQAFDASPAAVSERLIVAWMNANPVARVYARSLDFARFASRYNGCDMPCDLYAGRLRAAYNTALPAWRAVEGAVGVATLQAWPSWAPWAIAGGIGTVVLGGAGLGAWAFMRHRRRAA
jgi:hypothetical protein